MCQERKRFTTKKGIWRRWESLLHVRRLGRRRGRKPIHSLLLVSAPVWTYTLADPSDAPKTSSKVQQRTYFFDCRRCLLSMCRSEIISTRLLSNLKRRKKIISWCLWLWPWWQRTSQRCPDVERIFLQASILLIKSCKFPAKGWRLRFSHLFMVNYSINM